MRPRAVIDRRKESAIAFAQEHRDTAVSVVVLECSFVGHGEVGFPVAVEIAHCHVRRIQSRGVTDGGLEAAIAVAQQHRDVVRVIVRHGDVRLAVAIKIAQRQGHRTRSHFVVYRRLEGAIALAQQH